MQLTDIIGTSFLVNVDSVVYAYARGSGATLLLSKGNKTIDVDETVAEVITAAGTSLTAFTALSGDATGSIAVNPNFVLTVASVNSGNDSRIVLCDSNNETKATIVVDTAFASMDAIIEAAAGGTSYSVYTALLSQTGTDAPVATVLENTLGGTVVWTRDDVGIYTGTLAGAFTESKTYFSMTGDADSAFFAAAARTSADTVQVYTFDQSTAFADIFSSVSVEIRVYP